MDITKHNTLTENLNYISQMQKCIKKAGGLFYQYRPCRLDEYTIYDIDNIKHGVVYAQTPLNMNDPFDSQIGFSADKLFDELIDIVFNALDLEDNLKVVLRTLIKYDLLGEIAELVSALNELKKQIALLRKTMHKEHQTYIEFLSLFKKQIYQRLPKTIKKYFTDQSFLLFGFLVEKISEVEISEDDIKNLVMPKEKLETIKKQIIALRDEIYIPKFEEFLSGINVTCFSVSGWKNALMWSHYANYYRGICVEYDFTQIDDFPGIIKCVEYSDKRPTISLRDMGVAGFSFDEKKNVIIEKSDSDINKIIDYLCVKSPVWSYEEEWRIIDPLNGVNEPSFIKVPRIKSITLGLKMDPLCRKLLLNVCAERNIDCYELIVGFDDFKIDRRKVDNSESDFDIDLETDYMELLGKNLNKSTESINGLAEKINAGGTINYRDLLTSNQVVIDILTNIYFMKLCINIVIKKVSGLEQDVDIGQTKETVASINKMVNEADNYYKEQRKIIDAIPLVVRLHNVTIRDIEKHLFRIESLLKKFKDVPWIDCLI